MNVEAREVNRGLACQEEFGLHLGLEKPLTGFKSNVIRSGLQSIILPTVKNAVEGRRLKQRDHL